MYIHIGLSSAGKGQDPVTQQMNKQNPISLRKARKTDLRTQFAALCYRIVNGKAQVLLITSRRGGRWIIPKGWPMDGKTPGEAALQEAWEEAGVSGKVAGPCLGLFSYHKDMERKSDLPCVAMIYPVRVKSLAKDFPEAGMRKRKWMSPKKAAARISDPELAHIVRKFDPRVLRS